MVLKNFQKLLGLSIGDTVSVSFDIANQDAITVPMELHSALDANVVTREVRDSWTPGKRAGFCCRINLAKMSKTREHRVE